MTDRVELDEKTFAGEVESVCHLILLCNKICNK